jgi:hypothetical protein
MGVIARLACSFGLLLLAAGSAAQAEVMHMPFDCRSDGGRVHLQPSSERTYPIIGRHEREIFTACSPTEPDTCRNWFVHRFEFDCDGTRVAWIDAAAAGARFTDWNAWVEGGRFRMRMNRLWGVARARPLAQQRRWMRRRFRDREDAFAEDPGGYGPQVVTVRPGFAPAAGIPLTFSGEAPQVAEAPAPWEAGAPAVAGDTAKPAPAPIPELPERAPSQAERLAAASAPPVVAPAPRPVTKVVAAQEAPAMAAPGQKAVTTTKTGDGATGASKTVVSKTPGFTIINGPHATGSEPPATAPPPPEESGGGASPIETAAVMEPAPPAEATTPPSGVPSSGPEPAVTEPVETGAVPSEVPPQPPSGLPAVSPEVFAAAAATTMALAGLAVLGLWRGRRRPYDAQPVRRDIGDISLDGDLDAPRLAVSSDAAGAGAPAPASFDSKPGDAVDADVLAMPKTYAEALDVLGASADASTSAIKKIVDGLRQSWHPDLARSESDRNRREARLRQINVAWDLVSQKHRAA